MKDIINGCGMGFTDGFMHPFTYEPENQLYYDNTVEYCAYGFGSGLSSTLIIAGSIFVVAARAGAVVPVKWRPLWSKKFWSLNH